MPTSERRGHWLRTGSRVVYSNPWMSVREDQVIRPDGKPGIYGVVETTPAVGVVALTDDRRIHIVGQHRYAIDAYAWEVPAGFIDEGESFEAAARRELLEETGLAAQRWTSLGHSHPVNGFSTEVYHLFLAEQLSQGQTHPDEAERLTLKTLALDEALDHVCRDWSDALTQVAVFRAWHLLIERDRDRSTAADRDAGPSR